MASSVSGKSYFDGNYHIYVEHKVSQLSQSIANNHSVVRVQLWLGADNLYSASRYGLSTTIPITVAGQTKELTLGDYNISSSWQNIGYVDFTVPHNSDGAKNIDFSYSCNIGTVSGYVMGKSVGSGRLVADTIPRASTIDSVALSVLGKPVTVVIGRKASSFTHQVWYRVSGGVWHDCGSGWGTTCTFTPPVHLCANSPNSLKNLLDISVRTFNGSTQIGDDTYSNGWTIMTLADDVKPTIGTTSITEGNAQVKSMLAGTTKEFLQHLSVYKMSQGTATAKHGATIKDYLLWFNGAEFKGKTKDITGDKAKGNITIWYGVRDSRGVETWVKDTIYAHPYKTPALSGFSAKRSGGGTNVKIIANTAGSYQVVTVNSEKKNAGTLTIYTREKGESWTKRNEVSTNGTGAVNMANITVIGDYDLEKSFDVKASIVDSLGKKHEAIVTVPTARVLMAWGKYGIGIGGIPESGTTLDVTGLTRLRRAGSALALHGPKHVYQEFYVGDERKAWFGFGDVGSKYFSICNEYTGKKLSLQENGRLGYNGTAEFDGLWIGNRNIGDAGAIIWGDSTGTSMLSGVWTDHRTITLSKGIWIVDCGYVANQAGKYLDYELKGLPFGFIAGTLYCQDGNDHSSTSHGVVNLDKTTTITLRAWSSNGMTSAKNHYVRATKIIGY